MPMKYESDARRLSFNLRSLVPFALPGRRRLILGYHRDEAVLGTT
jgi:hypothetical protein